MRHASIFDVSIGKTTVAKSLVLRAGSDHEKKYAPFTF